MNLTKDEQTALRLLIDLSRAAYFAMEDSEQLAGGESLVPAEAADDMSEQLDKLDELPDDKPGVYLGPVGKAEWALRRLLAGADHVPD